VRILRFLMRAITASTIASGLWVAPAPASAATGACDGVVAKVSNASVIRGGPRADVLIGGPRSQRILGGAGDDRICAGGGNDVVAGGGGNDTIRGDGRGDTLLGGGGADRIFGDILDDKLIGGRGADALIGGHGVDRMFGGPGNDLLRGGVNTDCYFGQGGENTASFATATPPGPNPGTGGVRVDLDRPSRSKWCKPGSGVAAGDGNDPGNAEVLKGIQFVVGSAFADEIQGRPGEGVDAGLGDDSCAGFGEGQSAGCGGGDEKPAGAFAYVFEPVTGAPPDPGLIVRGGEKASPQTITVSGAGTGATVTAAGETLVTGPKCNGRGTCSPATGSLGYVVVYGGDGADSVTIGEGLPPDTTVDVDGGPGNDDLNGSSLGEVLLGGDFPGADALDGNGGDDALISEGGDPAAGPDVLSGGPGDDQLAADYPCAGDSLSGGLGDDVAGFAPSGVGVRARMGGLATLLNGTCAGGTAARIQPDNEVLEGSLEADHLVGSARPETIWGREGRDVVIGRGGADDLEGFAGRDFIDARDGQRDRKIDCGSGPDRARRDRIDPPAVKC
jgi:Ca2+-binding RTX toxin-like protein